MDFANLVDLQAATELLQTLTSTQAAEVKLSPQEIQLVEEINASLTDNDDSKVSGSLATRALGSPIGRVQILRGLAQLEHFSRHRLPTKPRQEAIGSLVPRLLELVTEASHPVQAEVMGVIWNLSAQEHNKEVWFR